MVKSKAHTVYLNLGPDTKPSAEVFCETRIKDKKFKCILKIIFLYIILDYAIMGTVIS